MAAVCSRWVAGRWSQMACMCELLKQSHYRAFTTSASVHLESLQQTEQMIKRRFALGQNQNCWVYRKGHPHQPETLGKRWFIVSPQQAYNIAGGSLMPNTSSNQNCWMQRVQLLLFLHFFKKKGISRTFIECGHFCLPWLIHTMEERTST